MRIIAAAGLATLTFSAPALAGVQIYEDFSEWGLAAGDYTTLDFTGFSEGEYLGDQYADLGVTFPDGNDFIDADSSFVNDGWGVCDIFFDGINMVFDSPRDAIALQFVGAVEIDLFLGDSLVYDSPSWAGGDSFIGLHSSIAFDRAFITDVADGDVCVDDVYLGAAIPAPPTALVLLIGPALGRRRRLPSAPAS